MDDHECPPAKLEGVGTGDGPVGLVGELEPAHSIQPHNPDPIRDQRVLPTFSRQHSAVGMCHDPGAHAAEHDRAEVMVRMVVREDEPLDRPGTLPSESPEPAVRHGLDWRGHRSL